MCSVDAMAFVKSFIVCILSFFVIDLFEVSSQWNVFKESMNEKNFNYSNCNSSAVPLYVKYLHISPDPIMFGNEVKIDLDMTLDEDAGIDNNSIEVDLSLRLKTKTGYTELCQIIGESYCHYNDLCSILKDFMTGKKCPEDIRKKFNNTCACPFNKGPYNIQGIKVHLMQLSFEVRGTFVLTVNLHEKGKILGCVEIQFCITDCNPLGYR